MNGGPEFTKAVIEHGMPPPLAEANVRYLGEAEEVPRLRRGRPSPKKQDATWDASHYAIGILALGTSLPINAPATAQKLGSFKWVRATKHTRTREPDGRTSIKVEEDTEARVDGHELRLAVERQVLFYASKDAAYREEVLSIMVEHAIVLSVDGGTASISYQYEDDYWTVDHYSSSLDPEDVSNRRAIPRRKVSVELPLSLVVVCGGLLAETLAAHAANSPLPPSDGAPGSAEPEPQNENAAAPGRTAARTRKPNRSRRNSRRNATGPSDSQEGTEIGIGLQSLSVPRVRRPLLNRKDALHHAQVAQL